MIRYAIMLFALIFCAPLLLQAETYRYTDNKGTVNFVDDLAKIPQKYRKNARTADDQPLLNVMDAPAARPKMQRVAVQPARAEQFNGSVEIYVTSWCGYCKKAINYLNSKGISYTAYDIEKDSSAHSRYQELGGSGVPVIKIGDKVIRGFSPQAIDQYTGH